MKLFVCDAGMSRAPISCLVQGDLRFRRLLAMCVSVAMPFIDSTVFGNDWIKGQFPGNGANQIARDAAFQETIIIMSVVVNVVVRRLLFLLSSRRRRRNKIHRLTDGLTDGLIKNQLLLPQNTITTLKGSTCRCGTIPTILSLIYAGCPTYFIFGLSRRRLVVFVSLERRDNDRRVSTFFLLSPLSWPLIPKLAIQQRETYYVLVAHPIP